jgi:hypothetical protein
MKFFTKNSPISSIFDQILQFENTFQSIFHALHESNNKKLKIFFFTILDQERSETVRNGERSETVNGQEHLGTIESERSNALKRKVENGHGTFTVRSRSRIKNKRNTVFKKKNIFHVRCQKIIY